MFKDDGKCGESLGMSDLTKLVDCKDGVTSHLSTVSRVKDEAFGAL